MTSPARLAIVASHPVQYYAPWFRHLATCGRSVRVFYLWGGGHDPGFGREIQWDLDLLSGYDHEFVPNLAGRPGTDHFNGLKNPRLSERLRAWGPDAILVFGYGWLTLAQLALTWRGCPLILRGDTHLIGRDAVSACRRLPRRLLLRILLGRYRGFAAVGDAHARFLVAHGVPASKIFRVPHCVDNARWAEQARGAAPDIPELRVRIGIPITHRVVLFVGKFEAKKRPDLLLAAFRLAARPHTSLLFVGDGPLSLGLKAFAKGFEHVHFLPFRNQRELPAIFALADVLVLPSEGPGETWGLVVNEAMATGLPCIVSDHVGCRADLVIEGVTGWSFPHGDCAALATCLDLALTSIEDHGEELRDAARTRVALFNYEASAAALWAALAAISPPFKV